MLAGLDRIDRLLGAVLRPVVFIGMAALTAVITLQIVSRVAFTSVSWTEEVARFLLIWITFLGAALAWQQGRHLAVALLRDSLPDGPRRLITGAAILVSLAFMVALTIIGIRYMNVQSFQKSPSLRLSMSYVYAVMPLAAALMAMLSVIDLIRLIAGRPARDAASDLPEIQ
ncbi:TRAP transporter small permease [Roseovarius sp. M141]|uniref:TRAP transporter small permease n=1 Tax=Roseovarius sp. M141 TaxID=2583806 RepID=UPI0020CD4B6C|nr:TRAP transporter small permease [Roseovarius sp. M141]MCQ0090839.1 TRAP transporter small permease [Roseovarius sp. M141]